MIRYLQLAICIRLIKLTLLDSSLIGIPLNGHFGRGFRRLPKGPDRDSYYHEVSRSLQF